METLNRVAKIIKDFCGVLTEESIRKNFVLIYEILDETIVKIQKFINFFNFTKDFGHPQFTSTEQIKGYIVNEPVTIIQASGAGKSNFVPSFFNTSNTISSSANQRPVNEKNNKKNEIFVDIFEKISVF